MLYRLSDTDQGRGTLEPHPFLGVADLQRTEKYLETLLADHLLEVLFEDARLMPIFQERQLQSEADVYALNKAGDLVIFELKRGQAETSAVLQAIGYAQDAGQWRYSELQRRYDVYLRKKTKKTVATADLREAHREDFQLESALPESNFNCRQHLYVVGSAANEDLIRAIDYWKKQGLSVEFLPYRIYKIENQLYFEFFSFPYDRHQNPATIKGVLFDTNRTWLEDAIWEMMEKKRVAAYGDIKHVVEYLKPRDIVFYWHKGFGVIAAAKVTGSRRSEDENEEYRQVEFLTRVPSREKGIQQMMTPAQVSKVTGKTFFWARTMKVPYLNRDECNKLLAELIQVVGKPT